MNREDIFRMAQEAGFEGCAELTWESVICTEELETFAKLVAQHEEKRLTDAAMKAIVVAIETAMALEREACADIAENWNCNGMPRVGVAAQIRARGNHD